MKKLVIPIVILLGVGLYFGKKYYNKVVPPEMSFSNNALKRLEDGSATSVDAHKGKVIIVSCFQSWCSDCARETPVLNQLATELNDPNFKVLYISDEDQAKIYGFKNRFASDKIVYTQSAKSLKQLGIHVFPTTYLIDKDGKVIMTKLEGYDWLLEKQKIKDLLAK